MLAQGSEFFPRSNDCGHLESCLCSLANPGTIIFPPDAVMGNLPNRHTRPTGGRCGILSRLNHPQKAEFSRRIPYHKATTQLTHPSDSSAVRSLVRARHEPRPIAIIFRYESLSEADAFPACRLHHLFSFSTVQILREYHLATLSPAATTRRVSRSGSRCGSRSLDRPDRNVFDRLVVR